MRFHLRLGAACIVAVMLASCATMPGGGVSIGIPGTSIGIPIPPVITDPISSASLPRKAIVAGATSFDIVRQAATIYVSRPACPKAVVCRDPAITRQVTTYMRQGISIRNQIVQFALDHPGQLGDPGLQAALDQIVANVAALIQ